MMDLIKAQEIVRDIAVQRERWGKLYDASGTDINVLLDALVCLKDHIDANADDMVPKAELTRANRQLAASVAREAKLKAKLADQDG